MAEALTTLAAERASSAATHVVVQFTAPLTPAEKGRLANAGVQLLNYVGDNAYYAVMDHATLRDEQVSSIAGLSAASAIALDWKLHPTLLRGEVMPWALAGPDAPLVDDLSELDSTALAVRPGEDPMVAAYVLFHPDVDLANQAVPLALQYGAFVRSEVQSINALVVEIPYRSIAGLAGEDAVQYIEPPLPRFSDLNDSNRQLTGADIAQALPYDLDGDGVRVLVYDGGTISATHPDLVGRVRIGDSDGVSDHSTHVSGTIGGDGTASAGLRRGMAPGVVFDSYGFETGGPLEAGFLYTDPGDIEADYSDSILNFGSDISNNSIGSNVAPNGFPCAWEGDYNVTSALIDAIVRGSLGNPFRIVWAGGNERGNGSCGTTFSTIPPPSGAKNHISVGALNSNNDTITSFSSWGPTDDGRLKPDLSAPGCEVGNDGGVTSTSSSGGYNVKCGTSMACPTVTGLSSLLLQDFRVQYPGDPDFRNSTLKALLAHTAVDLGNTGPDYRHGYGSVRIIPAIEQMRAGNFLEGVIEQSETAQFLVIVTPADTEIRVTVAWDDAPGAPAVNPVLVNDLDVVVVDAANNTYFPWTLNPAMPDAPAVRTQQDHTNNLVQIVVDAPPPGSYLVRVSGFNVPQGPQPFSLVASPVLINCSPQGTAEFDQIGYQCTDTAQVEVNDCDLNTDDLLVETVQVTVDSDTEPAGEIITLTETGPATAYFVGTIDLAPADSVGVLQVTELDMVSATYIDADDGFGNLNVPVVATAVVDCTAPMVSNVAETDLDPRNATIVFDTNEDASGAVMYGTSCALLDQSEAVPGFRTSHSIHLSQLTDNTTYFYAVEAADPAGNVTLDDDGGACHSFTTPEIPDFYTEQFDGDWDLENRAILLAPNGSVDFYGACSFETLVLPTDPAGGTNVSLNDSGSIAIPLTGGNQVLLYGVSYNLVHINANGNLTFTESDADQTETIAEHFEIPRVAALYDDLDPFEGGNVSWKQLADRFTVTWLNVPEDNGNNSNTFQIELYYDGRIQLAWLNIDANDGIVGLSAGGGIPIDFFESELSGYASCGPRAPSAAGRTVVLGQDREAEFDLLASDDGLPDPPGALSYIVTSLPTYELRDASDDHIILPGDLPYTLVGGGKTLLYSPTGGFVGLDSFDFKANDGGSPPDAGDSNTATVILQVEPVLNLPLLDTFPATTFDAGIWSLVNHATIDDGGIAEPSPPYSARINSTPTGGDELRSHLVDLSGLPSVRLMYAWQRTGTGESPDSGENLRVEFLDDQMIWQPIHQYAGDGPDMETYIIADALLPAAALHDSFRLRFRTTGTSGTTAFDDWFVDDVSLSFGDAPITQGAQVSVRMDELTDITLSATDPNGDPLDLIVTQLPGHGSLYDAGAGLIEPGDLPYTLVANGNLVQYQRELDYVGPDELFFKANDGTFDSFESRISVFVEPILITPFEEMFPDVILDDLKWAVRDGTTVDTLSLNPPSAPYAARLNGDPSGSDVLTTYDIDLAGFTNMAVQYYWQRTGAASSPETNDDLFVEYLNDLGQWQLINQHLGSGADMTTFELVQFIIPADGLHEGFRLRIRTQGTAGAGDDWFVDNVRVYSLDGPTANDQNVLARTFGVAWITLAATDPNLDPLDYTVASLPVMGQLWDTFNGHQITPDDLPYLIPAGSNDLLYLPPLGLTGSQSFDFLVNDGVHNSNQATVSITIGGEQPALGISLDADPGWATEGNWAFGVPLGMSGDPTSGFTGANVYGYNLSGPYEAFMSPTYLTTTPLDLSLVSSAELRFRRWLGVEDSLFDQASIEISTNGTDWSIVWEHSGPNIADTSWTLQTYDISAAADGESAVQLRWSMGPSDSSVQLWGWNIDDVTIFGDVQTEQGDVDGDGDIDIADHRAFAACLSGPGAAPSPPAPMTLQECRDAFDFDADLDVDLADGQEFNNAYTDGN